MESFNPPNLLNTALKYRLLPYQINLLQEYIQSQTEKPADLPRLLKRIEKQLTNNTPVEYITKYTYFGDNKYIVRIKNCKVYIPAPKTLELVEKALEIHEQTGNTISNTTLPIHVLFLDIGTGSGAILIEIMHRLMKNRPPNLLSNYTFIGTDISKCALRIAKKNLKIFLKQKHNYMKLQKLSENIHLINADIIFQPYSKRATPRKERTNSDTLTIHPTILAAIQHSSIIIVTFNKPYVSRDLKNKLPKEMVHYPENSLYTTPETVKNWRKFLKFLQRYKSQKHIFILQETTHNPNLRSAKIIWRKL